MASKKNYLEKHNFNIWQGKDYFWRTYLPDEKNGRKLIKRKNKAELEKIVINYYREQEENPTIYCVFSEWNNRRYALHKISKSTYERNIRIYQRHYSTFGRKKIRNITRMDFIDFLEEQISKNNLTSKGFSNLKSITRGFLKRASANNLIAYTAEDVFNRLDLTDTTFRKTVKEDYEEVYNEEEMDKIMDYLISHPEPANLGICLMFVSGLRVGELVALKNEDLDDLAIRVRRTETRYKDDNGTTIYGIKDFPKTVAGVRTIPIPQDYAWLIKRIRHLNPFGEYVFLNRKGKRMTANSIRTRLRTIGTVKSYAQICLQALAE